jgi:adenylate kinase
LNLILFGPPGAGKGTQSALLTARQGMVQISTGDMFRAAIRNKTKLGLEAKGYMDKGQLVPDSVTIQLVDEVVRGLEGPGFILDGFPRTVAQADALEELLSSTGRRIDRTVFLEVPISDLLGRLVGRRTCQTCGTVYHATTAPPRVPGVCDKDGGAVVQRPDDREEVIRTRLEAYETSTAPLKEYYKAKGNYVVVDGLGSSDEVYGRIAEALRVKV